MFLNQLAFTLTETQLKWIYEATGILASTFVLISFLFSNQKKTRIINIIGAAVFVAYGLLVKAYSTSIMNGALIIVHVVKLIQGAKQAKKPQKTDDVKDDLQEDKEPKENGKETADEKDDK